MYVFLNIETSLYHPSLHLMSFKHAALGSASAEHWNLLSNGYLIIHRRKTNYGISTGKLKGLVYILVNKTSFSLSTIKLTNSFIIEAINQGGR